MPKEKDPNRKTNIPVRTIPRIIQDILSNATGEQLDFMSSLVADKTRFAIFTSILSDITDRNVYSVFYEKITDPMELALFRAAARGEVAGLKSFAMACQAADEEIESRKKK